MYAQIFFGTIFFQKLTLKKPVMGENPNVLTPQPFNMSFAREKERERERERERARERQRKTERQRETKRERERERERESNM